MQFLQDLSLAAAPIYPQSVAPGTIDTGSIDSMKFGRLMFNLTVGVFGASATVDMKLQESVDNVTFTDVATAAITQLLAAGGNNRLASIEVRRSQLTKRYVRARITVGTATTIVTCLPLASEPDGFLANSQDVAAVAQRLVV